MTGEQQTTADSSALLTAAAQVARASGRVRARHQPRQVTPALLAALSLASLSSLSLSSPPLASAARAVSGLQCLLSRSRLLCIWRLNQLATCSRLPVTGNRLPATRRTRHTSPMHSRRLVICSTRNTLRSRQSSTRSRLPSTRSRRPRLMSSPAPTPSATGVGCSGETEGTGALPVVSVEPVEPVGIVGIAGTRRVFADCRPL